MEYDLIVGIKNTNDGTKQTQAVTKTVNAETLPDTAMYHIWLKSGYTPISVSGSQFKNGHSGKYKFSNQMLIKELTKTLNAR